MPNLQGRAGLLLMAAAATGALLTAPNATAKPQPIEICVATVEKKTCAYRDTAAQRTELPVVILALGS